MNPSNLFYHGRIQWLLPVLLWGVFMLMTACASTPAPTSEVQAMATAAQPVEDLPADAETVAEPDADGTSTQSSPLPAVPSAADAADPFAYCAALGTVDEPGAPFEAGAGFPDILVKAIVDLGLVSPDAPPEFAKNAVWRCLNGQVLVCHFGANLPCLEKADTNQTPAPPLDDFCRDNPAAEFIPAVVTGRATVYTWRCADGAPTIVDPVFTPDERGFLSEFWYVAPAQ